MKWTCLSAITLAFLLQNNSAVASGRGEVVPSLEEGAAASSHLQRVPGGVERGLPTEEDPMSHIEDLRRLLAERELSGYIVPHNDEYQTEELTDSSKRLEWLTRFTGSAGTALIMKDQVILFVDGRYDIQAERQVPRGVEVTKESMEKWLKTYIDTHKTSIPLRIGFDPRLYKDKDFKELKKKSGPLVGFDETEENLIDIIWRDKPSRPANIIETYPERYAGETSTSKIAKVTKKLREKDRGTAIISDLDAIAWLLNIRGVLDPLRAESLTHTPVVLGTLLLHKDETSDFFVENYENIEEAVQGYLNRLRVRVHPVLELASTLERLEGSCVFVDENLVSRWIISKIPNKKKIAYGEDLVWEFMVAKNDTEIANIRLAHICDGVSLCNFLSWLNSEYKTPGLTEKSLTDRLLECRQKVAEEFKWVNGENLLVSNSFPTISAFGPNAALPHYSLGKQESGALIVGNGLYLVDSGAQYRNGGTTDITRTVALGKPTEEQMSNFTRVLKGHIALASAQFPKGTLGVRLDGLARQFLWEVGLDYTQHGTGHGVGSFLSVHEKPGSSFSARSLVPLREGMVVSNEPGYYQQKGYGIRTENLMLVVPALQEGFSRFETISLAPIDKRLIKIEMLTDKEKSWLNNYHQLVFDCLGPYVDKDSTYHWLQHATAPIDRTY